MKKIILSAGIGLVVIIGSVFLQTNAREAWLNAVEEPASATAGVGSSIAIPEEPSRLRIEKIGVDANVQYVGVTQTGNMGIPDNYTDVGWYKHGPRPGMQGSAVIAGHVDGRNTPRAVFYDLNKLVKGDVLEIEDTSGQVFKFKVVDKKLYDYKETDTEEIFLGDPNKIRLNLITCTGEWVGAERTYNTRVVIFTELIQE